MTEEKDIKKCLFSLAWHVSNKFNQIITDEKWIQKELHIQVTKVVTSISVPQEDTLIVRYPAPTLREKIVVEHYENLSPFALLMPLSMLGNENLVPLYKKHGLSLIVLNHPIKLTEKGKPVDMAWFIWGVHSGNQMFFEEL